MCAGEWARQLCRFQDKVETFGSAVRCLMDVARRASQGKTECSKARGKKKFSKEQREGQKASIERSVTLHGCHVDLCSTAEALAPAGAANAKLLVFQT